MPGNHFFGYESSDEDVPAADLEEHDRNADPEEHGDPREPVESDEPPLPADEAPARSIFRFGCSEDSAAAADPDEIAEPLEVRRYEEKFESEGRGDRQKPVVSDTPMLTTNKAQVSKIFRFGFSDDPLDDGSTAAEAPDGSTEPLKDAGARVPDCLGDVERRSFDRDVERDVREIRALLAIHTEILDLCVRNATLSDGKITITRFGFEEIRTRQTGSKLELFTRPERSERTFDVSALSELPPCLEGTLAVRYMDGPLRGLIDYEDLFRRALMLLRDDALAVFLPRLRERLELALVRLEDADSWVLQPGDNASFVERVFMRKLNRPDASVSAGESPGRGASAEGGDGRPERVLAECTVSGTYATTFNLSMGSERTRLVRFLFYVCG